MSIIDYHTMPTFKNYFQPKTVNEAISILDRYSEGAKILAGGTDLLVLMRSRDLVLDCIVDITRISELDYIKYDEKNNLTIGALATLRAVELSNVVKEKYPLLYEAVSQMATTQVRCMGTIVGNICRASPAADTIPPLLTLEAKLEIAGPGKNRIVPINEFFTAPGKTVLKHNEIVTGIQVPKLPENTGTAFFRLTRVAADLAKVNVASVVTIKDGAFEEARIALGAVAPTPIRARKTENFLQGKKLENNVINETADLVAAEICCISDVRSTEEYRKEACKVLVGRAIRASIERAQER